MDPLGGLGNVMHAMRSHGFADPAPPLPCSKVTFIFCCGVLGSWVRGTGR